VRLFAQYAHPGYWQEAHPKEIAYRPDQIMRYSEVNLNRLQIAGEWHVKSGITLNPERVPELTAPLDIGMLYDEASFEDRAHMARPARGISSRRCSWMSITPNTSRPTLT